MQLQTGWVPTDSEMRRIKDVLNGGLHGDLHEDEIEDLRAYGQVVGRVLPRGRVQPLRQINGDQHFSQVREDGAQDLQWQGQIVGRASGSDIVAIGQSTRAVLAEPLKPERPSRVPAAKIADEWFNHNYPKLKREDLADHYRKSVLAPPPPVVTAIPRSFDRYRDSLKAHVVNSNYAEDDDPRARTAAEPLESALPKTSLTVSPDLLAMHRSMAEHRPPSKLGRALLFMMVAGIAILAGGAVGLVLANPEKVQTLMVAKAALFELVGNGPVLLRN